MKAVVIHEHGGPSVLKVEDRPKPTPGPGEVLVRVHAAAVNHLDLWVRRGIEGVRYPLPMIPGCDGAGVVAACGAGVSSPQPGTRVALQPGTSCGHCAACLTGDDPLCRSYGILGEHRDGTQAEYISVPRANVMPIADSLSFEEAAAFPLAFLTAWQMVAIRARVRPGDQVLVHAGASGVGSAAIQIAQLMGAHVFTTVGSQEKAAQLRKHGVQNVILYRDCDFADEIRTLTGKRGVDVIIDHIGADTWDGNIRCLTKGGRLVLCGATSGHMAPTNLRFLFFKNLSFLGSTMGSKAELLRILGLVEAQKLRPWIHSVLPMEDIQHAHEILESRQVTGKVVVQIA